MQLRKNEIHIYLLSIENLYSKRSTDSLLYLLSEDEKKRANSFKFKKHQDAYIFSRGMLRNKLSGYTGIKPEQIKFQYGDAGKPEFKNKEDIKFNVSHSEDLIAFAFLIRNEIGVDIQHMRDLGDLEGMINYNLSDSEQADISEYNQKKRKKIFYRFWTHKEAFIKATGEGLSYNLTNIEFSYTGNKLKLNRILNREIKPEDWFVFEIEMNDYNDYAGALIVENSKEPVDWDIKYFYR
jgi:4'-phosphopantetheinyl transferase